MWDVSGLWVGVGALVCGSGPGVCAVVCGSVQVYVGVHGCAEVWVGGRDEFSEYLLETRVLTSPDFNMYPI